MYKGQPVTAPALVTQPATPAAATTVAGTYSGMLPCADCEGMDTRLLLTADGKYTLTQIYQDKDHSSFVSEGGYTMERYGNTMHLRPTNKDEYDGYYEVLSPTQLPVSYTHLVTGWSARSRSVQFSAHCCGWSKKAHRCSSASLRWRWLI